jgi:isoquinoline 1-oxidoreductase beta subunit
MAANPGDSPRASRRGFLQAAGLATAAALTIGFEWRHSGRRAMADDAVGATGDTGFAPNAFLRIGSDDSVTVIAKHLEMGQGSYTGIATVLAEELDADWSKVRVDSAPADAKRYANLAFGMQGTGGSSAMANSWSQLREAGAKGRAILRAAAAQQWKIPVSELRVEHGVVYGPGGRQATFGALVATAATLPVPETVVLKNPSQFQLIGRTIPRVDAAAKTNRTAQFTIDVSLPGMFQAGARCAASAVG